MPVSKNHGLSENSLGAIAYITVVPAIFFLAVSPYNKKAYVRFHAWQSTVFFALTFILCFALSYLNTYHESIAYFYLGLYVLVSLVWFLVSLWCAIQALNGKSVKLPVIGAWAEKQSSK
jgi:uncharacterized membrane protein